MAQDGYRITPVTTSLTAGAATDVAFRITGPNGRPVTAYTPTHDKDLHLIVVRRDLSGYQHLHPRMAGDGTWSVPLPVAAAGQYRFFADFQPAARSEPLTLGVDLPAAGAYQPRPLPPPTRTTTVDGYQVSLAGELVPGTDSTLTLTVSKDGKPVTDLQPYLGAYGHLVALREGDLAYLHVHPEGAATGDRRAGRTFHARCPRRRYRLFLDFQHAGVRTAEFTATPSTGDAATTAEHRPRHGASHDDLDEPAPAHGRPDRAGDRRHDLRVLRRPHREEAQPAGRGDRHGQLRHREGDGHRRPPGVTVADLIATVEKTGTPPRCPRRRGRTTTTSRRRPTSCATCVPGCGCRWC